MIFVDKEKILVENEILNANSDSPFKSYIQLEEDPSLQPSNFVISILNNLILCIGLSITAIIVFLFEKYIKQDLIMPLELLTNLLNSQLAKGSPKNYLSIMGITWNYYIKNPLITNEGFNNPQYIDTEDTKILEHIVQNPYPYTFKSFVAAFVITQEEIDKFQSLYNILGKNKLQKYLKNKNLEELLKFKKNQQNKQTIQDVLNLYYSIIYQHETAVFSILDFISTKKIQDTNTYDYTNYRLANLDDNIILNYGLPLHHSKNAIINIFHINQIHEILKKYPDILQICQKYSYSYIRDNLYIIKNNAIRINNTNKQSDIDVLLSSAYFSMLIIYNNSNIQNVINIKAADLVKSIKDSFKLVKPDNATYLLKNIMYKRCFIKNQEIQFILNAHRNKLDQNCIYFIPKNLKYTLFISNIIIQSNNVVFIDDISTIDYFTITSKIASINTKDFAELINLFQLLNKTFVV